MKKLTVSAKKLTVGLLALLLAVNIGLLVPARAKAAEVDEPDNDRRIDYVLGRPLTDEEIETQKKHVKVGPTRPRDNSLFVGSNGENDSPFAISELASMPSYSLVDAGRVTSVKDQNPYGSCWAFAAVNSAESSLLSSGKASIDNLDLSEKHLAYFTYNASTDKLGNTAGDSARINEAYADYGWLDLGGNQYLAKGILAAEYGLVDESVMPYNNWDYMNWGSYTQEEYEQVMEQINAEMNETYPASLAYDHNKYVVDKERIVSLSNRDYVKQSLIKNGAAVISIFYDDSFINYDTCAFYNGYYSVTNHDVGLVGWDDNYSRYNFNADSMPAEDGAWLIKNSWGEDWGNGGYFWLSYEDMALSGEEYTVDVLDDEGNPTGETEIEFIYPDIYFYSATDAEDYSNIYQYDGAGDTDIKFVRDAAAVYTAVKSEYLSAVMVGVADYNNKLTVEVYKNLTDSADPISGTLAASKTVTYADPGYARVDFGSAVSFKAGTKFAIVVRSEGRTLQLFSDQNGSWGWVDFTSSYTPGHCAVVLDDGNSEEQWIDAGEDFAIKALTTTVASVAATGVSFASNPITVECDVPQKLDVTVTPSNSTSAVDYTFDEENIDISDGYITVLNPGTYTITATAGKVSANCTVIAYRSASSVSISNSAFNMRVGDERTITAEILPVDNSEGLTLKWSSSDKSVATVSNGKITAVAPGTANIVAYANAEVGKIAAKCKVTVVSDEDFVELKKITLSESSCELMIGDIYQLTAALKPANATYNDLTWTSSDESVAEVTADGIIKAKSSGSAVITVTAGDNVKSAECAVKIISMVEYIDSICEIITPNKYIPVSLTPEIIDDSDPEYPVYGEVPSKWFKYIPTGDFSAELVSSSSMYNSAPTVWVYRLVDGNLLQFGNADSIGDGHFELHFPAIEGEVYYFEVNTWMSNGDMFNIRLNEDALPIGITFVDPDPVDVVFTNTAFIADEDDRSIIDKNLDGKKVNIEFADGTSKNYVISYGKAGPYPITIDFDILADMGELSGYLVQYNELIYDSDGNLIPNAGYTDYYYAAFLEAGTHYITLNLAGQYFGDAVCFNVVPLEASKLSAEYISGQYYTGEALTPVPVLSKKLVENWYYYEEYWIYNEGTENFDIYYNVNSKATFKFIPELGYDFDVTYSNNIKVGKAAINVTDSVDTHWNPLTGTKTVNFYIAPAAPTSPKAVSSGHNAVTLSWSKAAGGADGYDIYRSEELYGTYKLVGSSATTSYVDKKSLTAGNTYYYKIRPYATIDGQKVYGRNSAVVKAKPVPAATTKLSAASAGYNSIKLNWNKVAGAAGYTIYYSTEKDGTYKSAATVTDGDTRTYTQKNLTCGVNYYYKLRAYSLVDGVKVYGEFSSIVRGKPVPAAPAGAKVESASYNSVKVSWNKVTGASGYTVFYSTSKDGTYKAAGTVTSGTTFTHKQIRCGTTYYYKVRAYRTVDDKKIAGDYSAIVSGKPVPAAPTNVKAVGASNKSIKVSWSKVTGASGYEIYYCTTKNGTYKSAGTVSSGSTVSYTHSGLKSGTTYYYKVRAFKTVDGTKVKGSYSAIVSGKTKA